MSIGGNHKRKDFWNEMIEKIQKKLSRWRGRSISLAGRVTLIKSVLFVMSPSLLSIFKLPQGVRKEVVKI